LSATALYLYCVVPATSAPPALSSPALDGGPVHAVRHQDLAALAHACTPEPYQGSEEAVRGWIAAHNAVVEEAWKSAASVLPMSFDVIVRGDPGRSAEANLVGWLSEHHPALRSRLQALKGRAEVGVQILWDIGKLTADETARRQAPGIRPRGRAYFAREQHRRELREQLEQRADADCRRYCENLDALADDVRLNTPRPVKGKRMVLNLSLLAGRAAIARVGDYLEGVSQEPGVEVRFTGPWPPYSFAGTFGTLKDNVGEQEDSARDAAWVPGVKRGKSTTGGA
jgi:gas vesicle protein GvpL/GvpF